MGIPRTFYKGLIVSCQAKPGSPLRNPQVMAAMAQAAEVGGAIGIRANGAEDIAAIRALVKLPIIGINKVVHDGYDVFITPTLESARQVAQAGAEIIALDGTLRPRPDGLTAKEALQLYKKELGLPVMADISTLEEGLAAAEQQNPQMILLDLGLPDIDGQTLVGYLRGIAGLAQVPIIAVTAWPEETARQMVTAYGCNGYISKPIDIRAFIDMVNAFFLVR